jgi:hypothetical protein
VQHRGHTTFAKGVRLVQLLRRAHPLHAHLQERRFAGAYA